LHFVLKELICLPCLGQLLVKDLRLLCRCLSSLISQVDVSSIIVWSIALLQTLVLSIHSYLFLLDSKGNLVRLLYQSN
jgi:hypothetical protein